MALKGSIIVVVVGCGLRFLSVVKVSASKWEMSHNFLQKFNAEKLATTFYSSQCLVVNVKADLELVVCVCLLVVCRLQSCNRCHHCSPNPSLMTLVDISVVPRVRVV